jgi:hypothetical protein
MKDIPRRTANRGDRNASAYSRRIVSNRDISSVNLRGGFLVVLSNREDCCATLASF